MNSVYGLVYKTSLFRHISFSPIFFFCLHDKLHFRWELEIVCPYVTGKTIKIILLVQVSTLNKFQDIFDVAMLWKSGATLKIHTRHPQRVEIEPLWSAYDGDVLVTCSSYIVVVKLI